MNEELAKKAYIAYGRTTDFRNYQGLPMPEWENLPQSIQEAWVNAASAISDQAHLNLHKLAVARCCWEVVAGAIPALPQRELTRRFILTQSEWESEESPKIFASRMTEAYDYARSLNSPQHLNWVNVSWIWY
ncbi:MAG: hypothetical protein RMZ41_003180 [Nostoc sp. DedVER02]|uniref:hypothetical protein n=1 Tax=unclassified Nostoc TaxID=2593658 RepID=UPI002AD411F1|nr:MULTISPECIES: hypothetical protein [unclassified Nostoc]MDZ7986841.1 hypothetical protein [Nostoc sp. DedVER02]MDZ8115743.1 hypothetical protein [Nostoc sp. DedVER01b]